MIHIAYPLFLYAPCVGILLMSIAITSVLLSKRLEKTKKRTVSVVSGAWKQDREAKKERQAILQLILIVGSFMIGYIPFTSTRISMPPMVVYRVGQQENFRPVRID